MRKALLTVLVAASLAAAIAACDRQPSPPHHVARVGDAVLTTADLSAALSAMPAGMDSATAKAQYVEQWVAGQLLAREAERRGLRSTPDVQRQLEENERNVLAAALLNVLYQEQAEDIPAAELEAYFERNRERLLLREPYVRIRFIQTTSMASAQAARAEMENLVRSATTEPGRDSAFVAIAHRHAVDTTATLALARSYIPQSRLTRQSGAPPGTIVAQLRPGETSDVLATPDSAYYVVQVVERVPAGAEPRLSWIADDIGRQLAIERRKQSVAREVQRLRTEAEARGELRVPIREDDWER